MKVLQKRFWFNEPHDSPLPDREIFVDGFAGGGGASVGIEQALGCQVDVVLGLAIALGVLVLAIL